MVIYTWLYTYNMVNIPYCYFCPKMFTVEALGRRLQAVARTIHMHWQIALVLLHHTIGAKMGEATRETTIRTHLVELWCFPDLGNTIFGHAPCFQKAPF